MRAFAFVPVLLALALALLAPEPATAQATASPPAADPARDWEVHRNIRRDTVLAYLVYDNGLSLALRCNDGGYEAILGGLPAPLDPRASTRTLGVAFRDEEMSTQRWNVAVQDNMAVSEFPAPFARQLRQGGRLQILVPEGGGPGRNLRFDVTLPTSPGSVDETLAACNRPPVDPRDLELDSLSEEGVPVGMTWTRRPGVQFPSNGFARGFSVVTCMTNPDGTLRDCVVESEHPRGGGFGQATLRAARRARVGWPGEDDRLVPTRLVSFRVNFVLAGYDTREDRENERRQREEIRRVREQERSAREARRAAGEGR